MKVWVVTADDHDYDQMSQWLVGAFTTRELADAAVNADRKAYKGHLKRRGGPNYEVDEVELDVVDREEESDG